jgi:hypothetical protein
MHTSAQKKNHNTLKVLLTVLIICAFLVGIFGVLEKTGTTNLLARDNQVQSDTPGAESLPDSGVNVVDYGNPRPEDSFVIDEKKPTTETDDSEQEYQQSDIQVVITSTRKSGDKLLIKSVITGTDTATCKANLVSGENVVSATSGTTAIEGQLSCDGLTVPLSSLNASKDWKLTVSATGTDGGVASSTADITL